MNIKPCNTEQAYIALDSEKTTTAAGRTSITTSPPHQLKYLNSVRNSTKLGSRQTSQQIIQRPFHMRPKQKLAPWQSQPVAILNGKTKRTD